MTLVIGLTGSIASGKSTVSLMFDDFNIPVIDADKVSRKVVRPGEPAYEQIVHTFGLDILREDATIDRKKLGEIVFNDSAKLKELNTIVHPQVRKAMIAQKAILLEEGHEAIVLDIPLLFESELESLVHKTVVVYVTKDTQLERLMERDDYTEEEASTRINVQMSLDEKRERADFVIDNNGEKYVAFEQLTALLRELSIIN